MNLLENLKNQFVGEGLRGVSKLLGETESNTKNAIDALLQVVLGSLFNEALTHSGSTRLLEHIRESSGRLLSSVSSIAPNARSLLNDDLPLLSSLFGSRLSEIVPAVSALSGVKQDSAHSLLKVITPLVLGSISKQLDGQTDRVAATQTLAKSQLGLIRSTIPTALAPMIEVQKDQRATNTERMRSNDLPSIATLMGILFFVLGAAYTLSRLRAPELDTAQITAEPLREEGRARADFTKLEGASASEENASKQSNEKLSRTTPSGFIERIALVIGDPELDKNVVFDGVNFELGTARLTPDSNAQLEEFATLLKSHSNTTIKISGFTDDTGNVELSRRLSLARANAVRDALREKGVSESRMATEGLGAEKPRAPNSGDAGRAMNRRLEVTILSR